MLLGLGSMIGTGLFVSLGLAAGIVGTWIVPAIGLAALVATCNSMSSAGLAINLPVSGGTYAYGYRYLSPLAGFLAGWLFLAAKSASAATAALGCAGYLLHAVGVPDSPPLVPVAVILVVLVGGVVLTGLQHSNSVNRIIVGFSLLVLAVFLTVGIRFMEGQDASAGAPLIPALPENGWRSVFHAAALIFVAFTGFGRIATLGEEVHNPRRTIPQAMMMTIGLVMVLYMVVAWVAVSVIGAPAFAAEAAAKGSSLSAVADALPVSWLPNLVCLGAMTAMLCALMNLLLGLSRVWLALGREGDVPRVLSRLNTSGTTPIPATLVAMLVVILLVFIGDIRVTWSFSAFSVLGYYAITNLAALRLSRDERIFSPAWSLIGLVCCCILAFSVEKTTWLPGVAFLTLGIAWHLLARLARTR